MIFSDTTDIRGLDPVHDNRHQLGDGPYARESLAFLFQIPEDGIAGIVYTWVSGSGLAGSLVTLFGPGIGPEPLLKKCDEIPVPAAADFNDWQVGNMHLRLGEPLQTAYISYKSELFDLDYNFVASQPIYPYSSHREGCPQWIASDRFEQQGRVTGKIAFQGRVVNLDCDGQRDHSWGTRDWGVNQHWKWVHANAGNGLSVHFWKLESLGQTLMRGYVQKQGHIAQLVDVDIDLQINDDLTSRVLNARIEDSAGRITLFQGVPYTTFELGPDPMITLFESPITAHIDGKPAVGCCEVLWSNSLIEYVRSKGECGQ